MEKVFTKKNVLFGFLLVAFVIVFEIILPSLRLPAWPAFMVMICFFIVHEDRKQAPGILIGGLAGILCVILLEVFIDGLKPLMGHETAKLIFIGLFVYAIVMLKDAIPYIFNSYAFMFFLVAALAKQTPNANPYIWMGVELLVGGIFIVGILGLNQIVAAILKK
jgi:hypothetical protein